MVRRHLAVALFSVASAAWLGAAPSSAASQPPGVLGMHLGMTSRQVVSTLRARRLAVTAITQACVSDYLAEHQRIVINTERRGHCVQSISADAPTGSVMVSLVEAYPERPGTSIATSIAFNARDGNRVIERVLHDAGSPSVTDGAKPWVVAVWCYGFRCGTMTGALEAKHGMTLGVHRGVGLSMNDDYGAARHNRAIGRALVAHGLRIVS